MLQILNGSVFDSKCDLLILPCDSAGGTTGWVEDEIISHDLPLIIGPIPFGKVQFLQSSEGYEKSNYIGYAASVDANSISSGRGAIESILLNIIEFLRSNGLSIVNIPILGTGAGKLKYDVVIQWYRDLLSQSKYEFRAYIPQPEIAQLYVETKEIMASNLRMYANPRVFISYCRKDKATEKWTRDLATKLRQNGVDAIIDIFHLKPGADLPQWMTNEIVKAQKVLLICDEQYAERADMRKAGVGWETMIIQGDMLTQGELNNKYIAIAFNGFDKGIPIFMKSKLGLAKEEVDKDFDALLVSIFDLEMAPDLGDIPQWIKAKMLDRTMN